MLLSHSKTRLVQFVDEIVLRAVQLVAPLEVSWLESEGHHTVLSHSDCDLAIGLDLLSVDDGDIIRLLAVTDSS